MRKSTLKKKFLDLKERAAWKKWNKENELTPHYSAEQILTWLDEMRSFFFEVWKHNPHLLEIHRKLQQIEK